jgi:hypothetical protein
MEEVVGVIEVSDIVAELIIVASVVIEVEIWTEVCRGIADVWDIDCELELLVLK